MAFYEGRVFILTLRGIQAVLTILILGLTGYGDYLPFQSILKRHT